MKCGLATSLFRRKKEKEKMKNEKEK